MKHRGKVLLCAACLVFSGVTAIATAQYASAKTVPEDPVTVTEDGVKYLITEYEDPVRKPPLYSIIEIIGYNADLPENVELKYYDKIADDAFTNCTKLKSLTTAGSFRGQTFLGCINLTDVTFTNPESYIAEDAFSGSGVTTIHGYTGSTAFVFAKDHGFQFVALDEPDAYNVWNGMRYRINTNTLYDGTKVSDPDITITGYTGELSPDAKIPSVILNTPVRSITDKAFYYCDTLTAVTVPESITEIGLDAFSGCKNLKKVTVMNANAVIGDSAATLGSPAYTTIYGIPGSTAEQYAKQYGYAFVSLTDEKTCTVGDVSGDGKVDTKDAMLLTRYVNGWEGVSLDTAAADLDGSGKVDTKDAMILTRAVNGWEGYEQYITGAGN